MRIGSGNARALTLIREVPNWRFLPAHCFLRALLMQLTSLVIGLLVLPAINSLRCFKAVGTKDFRPSSFHSTACMGHVTSCYSLTTKEDVVGHIVEGSEFDCDNQNVCAGLEGTCMTQANSVRCCCTLDNCNTAKRTVVINSAMKVTSSAIRHGFVVVLLICLFF